jgi:hypothetical protein
MNKPIKDFPLYMFDPETDTITNWKGKQLCVRGVKSFTMKRGEIHLRVTLNRLRYAVEHDYGYYEIPSDYFITMKYGNAQVIERKDILRFAHIKRQKDAADRLAIIDRKVNELFIMRYVYTTGDMKPAIEYVEGKRNYLLKKAMKRYGICRAYAEMLFSEASLIMYYRIESATNSVTELTMTTFGVMGKVRRKLLDQRQYYDRGTNTAQC